MSQQRKERVVSSSIWKVVYDTTTANYVSSQPLSGLSTQISPNVSSNVVTSFTTQPVSSTRVVVPDALKKYVQNTKHRDIVYQKLMERVEITTCFTSERFPTKSHTASNPDSLLLSAIKPHVCEDAVVDRVIALVRTFLPLYVPRCETLKAIQSFCTSIKSTHIGKFQSPIVKSVVYINNLVDQLIDQEESHQATQATSPPPVTTTSSPTNPQNSQLSRAESVIVLPNAVKANVPSKHRRQSSKKIKGIEKEKEKEKDNEKEKQREREVKHVVKNILLYRKPLKKLPKKQGTATLFDTLFFGGQFQRPIESEIVAPLQLQSSPQPVVSSPLGTVVTISSNLPPLPPSAIPGPSQPQTGTPPVNILTFSNDAKFKEHINVVKKSKLREQEKNDKEDPKRRAAQIPLFQYKYYIEQEPLNLSQQQIDGVISLVIDPSLALHTQGHHAVDPQQLEHTRHMASQILIKLLIDVYCSGGSMNSSSVILSIFFEMLRCNSVDTRVHAFNILFNLSIHTNLLDEIPIPTMTRTGTISSSSSNQTHPNHSRSHSQVPISGSEFEYENTKVKSKSENANSTLNKTTEQLFEFLREMVLFLYHSNEANERVWLNALHCILYFITEAGKIDRAKLLSIDIRVFVAMLQHIESIDEDTQRHLIRLLVNGLYPSSMKVLDIGLLNNVCGISFILDQYLKVRGHDARDNLFAVIYDYITYLLISSKHMVPVDNLPTNNNMVLNMDQLSTILEILKWVEASQYCVQLFKVFPSNWIEQFLNFIQQAFPQVSAKLDRTISFIIAEAFSKLAMFYNRLEPEFEQRLNVMKHPETDNNKDKTHHGYPSHIDTEALNALLHSNVPSNKKNGEIWLFELMKLLVEDQQASSGTGSQSITSVLKLEECVKKICDKLVQSPNSLVRRSYISVTERTILYIKSKITSFGDETAVDLMFEELNDNFLNLVKVSERNRTNLTMMLDIIFTLVVLPTSTSVVNIPPISNNTNSNPEDNNSPVVTLPDVEDDLEDVLVSPYTKFLNGELSVSLPLLKMVNITILQHVFTFLHDGTAYDESDPKLVVLLFFIIELCKHNKSTLKSMGGVAYFQRLLQSNDPGIAYIAGRYIIEQLEEEDPEQYITVLAKLLIKAQEEDDENIISNHYLQIKAILEMSKKESEDVVQREHVIHAATQ